MGIKQKKDAPNWTGTLGEMQYNPNSGHHLTILRKISMTFNRCLDIDHWISSSSIESCSRSSSNSSFNSSRKLMQISFIFFPLILKSPALKYLIGSLNCYWWSLNGLKMPQKAEGINNFATTFHITPVDPIMIQTRCHFIFRGLTCRNIPPVWISIIWTAATPTKVAMKKVHPRSPLNKLTSEDRSIRELNKLKISRNTVVLKKMSDVLLHLPEHSALRNG